MRAAVTCQEASEQLVRQWLQGANEQLAPQCQGEWCWGLRLPDWQGQAEQEQTACLPAVTSAHWSACQWKAKHTMCSCHALQSIGLQKAYCRQLELMAGDWHDQLTAKAEADKQVGGGSLIGTSHTGKADLQTGAKAYQGCSLRRLGSA